MRSKTLKIASANCDQSMANLDGLLEWATSNKYPVVCVQETPFLPGGRVRRHPGYTTITLDDKQKRTRTAIYVAKTHTTSQAWPAQPFGCAVVVSGVTIFNFYWHPQEHKAREAMSFTTSLSVPHNSIVVGDFNSKHPDWDLRTRDPEPRATTLNDWILTLPLYHLVQHVPTHNKGHTLDLAVGPEGSYAHVGHDVSDHKLIQVTCPASQHRPTPRGWTLPQDAVETVCSQVNDALSTIPPVRCYLGSRVGRGHLHDHGHHHRNRPSQLQAHQ